MTLKRTLKWLLLALVLLVAIGLGVRAFRSLSGPALQPWHTFVPNELSAAELADGVFAARERFYSWSSIGRRVVSREVPFSTFRIGMTATANIISRREIYKKQHRLLGR